MGFTPDHPLSRPHPSGIGACEWLVDEQLVGAIFERCRHQLPQTMRGGALAGKRATIGLLLDYHLRVVLDGYLMIT